MKLINFEKKKMILSRKEQKRSYEKAKICHICKKFEHKYINDKNHRKVKHHW